MHPSFQAIKVFILFVVLSTLIGCGGEDGLSEPPPVASVTVTSPIDDVMAVDRSVQLEAAALDASGNVLSGPSFTWDSSEEAVVGVDAAGLVQGLSSGTSTITATADGVSGSLDMKVVAAELQKISALLEDAYTDQLAGSLSAEFRINTGIPLQDCSDALDVGHIVDLQECLQQIQAVSGTDPTDQALLAVLGVIAERAELFLNL